MMRGNDEIMFLRFMYQEKETLISWQMANERLTVLVSILFNDMEAAPYLVKSVRAPVIESLLLLLHDVASLFVFELRGRKADLEMMRENDEIKLVRCLFQAKRSLWQLQIALGT